MTDVIINAKTEQNVITASIKENKITATIVQKQITARVLGGVTFIGAEVLTFIEAETTAVYKYYGFESENGWEIRRKKISDNSWATASGAGDYSEAWEDRASKTYL